MQDKLYVVRKYIVAKSASDAIKKDKTHPVDDVWADERVTRETLSRVIGFTQTKLNKGKY